MCEHEFFNSQDSSKRSHSDDDDDNNDNDDDIYNDNEDDYFDAPEMSMPQNKDKKRKPIEAVEKAMTDKELKTYYEQYISLLKEQRQQAKLSSEKQLHALLAQLFHSLQYKNEQPEGQLVFRWCQICFDRDEIVITMKVNNLCKSTSVVHCDFYRHAVIE